MKKWKGNVGLVVWIMTLGILLVLSGFAMAVTYDFGNQRKLYVTGYVQTQFGFGFDNEPSFNAGQGQYLTTGNTNGLNQVLMEGYLENHLKWGRDVEFRLTLRLWGDEVDSFRNGGSWNDTYGRAEDQISFGRDLRNPDREIRECNVGYFSRYFAFRIGKQQLVWGESDGLRLMDQINPLDFRRGPIYDADEGFINTRIPLWMIKTDFYAPETFEVAGIRDLDLELTWIPDVEPWDRYEIGPRKGGTWAYPVPDGYYLGPGMGLRQLNVRSDTPDRTLDNSSFGARLKFSWFDANVTLNYFYGWSAGGYLAPDENAYWIPPLARNMYGLTAWSSPTGNVGDGSGLVFDVWKKTYRQKTAGFTVSRQLTFLQPLMMKLFRQFDTPILRIEALYQFDKKYNVFDPGLKALGLPLAMNLPWYGPSGRYVKESDEIRYMVGLDFFALRVPWINSKDKVTLSLQFFQFHINDYDKTLYQAPYDWPLKRNAYAYSVLLTTGYWRQRIRPQIIFFRDMTYDSYFVKPRVQVDIGDHWRYEVGAYIFEGYHAERQFGLYDRRDTAYVKVKYQF